VRDYHDLIKRRLHALANQLRTDYPGSEYRSFVDTAPVNERELAAAAGLGWQAKNAMLIHPKLGSYLVLGGFATTLSLVPSVERDAPVMDHCGSCTRCIDACPTKAIVSERVVDARLCISNLTIERRTPIKPELQKLMGDWIAGCDICQQVCPHNSPRVNMALGSSDAAAGLPRAEANKPGGYDVREVVQWTEEQRRAAFATSALKRISLEMLKRNAEIAKGNWEGVS
jgi:epoxyqueuosine reductase